MYKYDVKQVVNCYLRYHTQYTKLSRWLADNDNLKGCLVYEDKLCESCIALGFCSAYRSIIRSLFMVSEKNFDKFVKAVVMGGNYENL